MYLLAAATFVLASIVAMGWDLVELRIPDAVPIALVLGFVLGAIGADAGLGTIAANAAAATAVFGMGAWLFARNVWGGGDVKLAAALSLWFGWSGLFDWLLTVAIGGGLLALAILLFRRLPPRPGWPAWLERLHQPGSGIPYGIALGAGGLACFGHVAAFLSSPLA